MSDDRVIYQGDNHTEVATLDDGATPPVPVDDDGAIYRLTVKYSPDDADNQAIALVTASQSAPGLAYLSVFPADLASVSAPAVLAWNVEVTESGGWNTTLASGKLTVLPSIFIGP